MALAVLRDDCPGWAVEPLRDLSRRTGLPRPLQGVVERLLARCERRSGAPARDATAGARPLLRMLSGNDGPSLAPLPAGAR
jgi:hypothetical protein